MRVLIGLGVLLATPALAADLDLFTPSGSVVHDLGTLQGELPRLGAEGVSLGLMAWVAEDLAVADYANGSSVPVLGTAFALPVYGAYTIGDKARVEVLLPLYLYADAPKDGFRGAALGDVELRAMVPLWEPSEAFSLGVVPALAFPTGSDQAYVGQGWEGRLKLAAGGTPIPQAGWVANVGLSGSGAQQVENTLIGSRLDVLAGAWWRAQPGFRLGADANFAYGLAKQPGLERLSTLTGHAFAQIVAENGLSLIVGGGSGLGVGAPTYRVFAGLTWTPGARAPKQPADPCAIPEGATSPPAGCPGADGDGDGVLDVDDVCPDVPGDPAHGGCPDTDGDGVFDDVDACVDAPGPEATQGCPDRDGDGVPDHRDACPDEPIPADADPAYSSGCVEAAFVTPEGRIKITQRINFELGSAEISADGRPILDQVAKILLANPQIVLVEVAGHTDNQGRPERNQELSTQRAEAVAVYLTDKGVPPKRLMPKGYGQDDPIDTNRTTAGRANNRRIEFVIRRMEGDAVPETAPEPTGEPTEIGPADEPIWR